MPTVLIVEDDIVFRKQLLEVFDHGNGFDAFAEAGNGVEALDKTKCLSPNLAILDLSLPDVSGIQLAQELMEITPGLRVFMLTGSGTHGNHAWIASLHADSGLQHEDGKERAFLRNYCRLFQTRWFGDGRRQCARRVWDRIKPLAWVHGELSGSALGRCRRAPT